MKQEKPNILFILTDDQGAWAMRCAGNTDIHTPNLDRIASQGYRFENFFCASPVCSPARASLLTGRIPSAHGVQDWIRSGNLDRDGLKKEIREDPYYLCEEKPIQYLEGMLTYTDVLKENGYTCALSGKWHLGDSMTPQHGFDKWFTIGRGGCYYNKADIVENGEISFENRYITNVITDKALSYLEEFRTQDNPFYLSVHYTAPHSPWEEDQHPGEYIEMYRDCGFTATPDLPVHPNQIPSAPSGTGECEIPVVWILCRHNGYGRGCGRPPIAGGTGNCGGYHVMFMADNGMNISIWNLGKRQRHLSLNMYDTVKGSVPRLPARPLSIRVVCRRCAASMISSRRF
ncbi:MAG: sulfatase-like hydrolase/transferase [Eisenbergiella massiliensis]